LLQIPLAASPGSWTLDPFQLGPLAVVVALYARRVQNLARRGRPVPGRRQLWFYSGVLLIALSFASPIDTLGEQRLFYLHMAQHLLLGDLGALAVVLGLDGAILRPVLAFPPVRRLRFLAHPLVALPLWVANLYVWHLPALYELALRSDPVHALQHQLFFLCGVLMWAAVVEPLPGPAWFGTGWKACYVVAVRGAGAVLANVFIWSSHPFYDRYAAGEHEAGIAPLTDQTIAGAIMFIEGSVVTLAAFAWLFLRWTRESELRQGLVDSGHDPALAERAARYGRSPLARDGGATPPPPGPPPRPSPDRAR
jgi:cytochrome c oxidase assembly factor CtaG